MYVRSVWSINVLTDEILARNIVERLWNTPRHLRTTVNTFFNKHHYNDLSIKTKFNHSLNTLIAKICILRAENGATADVFSIYLKFAKITKINYFFGNKYNYYWVFAWMCNIREKKTLKKTKWVKAIMDNPWTVTTYWIEQR